MELLIYDWKLSNYNDKCLLSVVICSNTLELGLILPPSIDDYIIYVSAFYFSV